MVETAVAATSPLAEAGEAIPPSNPRAWIVTGMLTMNTVTS